MHKGPLRHCPGCGQTLRFPEGVGGMLMACPDCGHRFATPFRLAGAPGADVMAPPVAAPPVPVAPLPRPEQATSPQLPTTAKTLAARVAALYASKA